MSYITLGQNATLLGRDTDNSQAGEGRDPEKKFLPLRKTLKTFSFRSLHHRQAMEQGSLQLTPVELSNPDIVTPIVSAVQGIQSYCRLWGHMNI
ncbi:MAG: hypothetical protein CL912_14690 [Deltaproteobacteria bacterium]|nr:hypothetical protein [Deltaproteobacteria bacterium]